MIDVTRLVGRFARGRLATGVDRVCVEYVRRYGTQARALVRWAGQDLVLHGAESQTLFRWLMQPGSRAEAYACIARGAVRGAATPPGQGAVLFNMGHSGLEHASYANLRERHGALPLFMVHDLIPISHPQFSRAGEREKHQARMRNVLAHGRAVVTNSRFTLESLQAFAHAEGLAMPPARVAMLAAGLVPAAASAAPRPGAYFVVLGTIEPRKNHALLLDVWDQLVEKHGDAAPALVVIGQRGWECEDVVARLGKAAARGRVIELAHCSDAELAQYLVHARALLFPSFVEGYGLPLVEALALGVPVIASDLAVFRESAEGIPELAEPRDAAAWETLVMKYAAPDSPRRAAQVERLAHFRAPTWDAHFAEVDGLLHEIGA